METNQGPLTRWQLCGNKSRATDKKAAVWKQIKGHCQEGSCVETNQGPLTRRQLCGNKSRATDKKAAVWKQIKGH